MISGALLHNLVVVYVDKKQKRKQSGCLKVENVTLRDEPYRQLFECRVMEIMSDNHNDLWGSFTESVLMS